MTRNNLSMVICAFVCLVAVADQSPAQPIPIVPLNTTFSHWDHHWIMWIPQHPIYEAIEAMSVDNPQSNSGRVVRVFLTERAGGKNQVNYFNNEAVVKRFRLESYYRAIEHQIEGEAGKPFNLFVKFKDKYDQWVELRMDFHKDQELTSNYAGLTDQSGHAADNRFLLFYREKTAVAANCKLTIGGQDYSIKVNKPEERRYLYMTGYRSNIYVVTVAYGQSRFTWSQSELANSWGHTFRKVSPSGTGASYRSSSSNDQGVIELMTNEQGDISEYRHIVDNHKFKVGFTPALPNLDSQDSNRVVRYTMALDGFGVLVEGDLSIRKEGAALLFDWQHKSPGWAKGYYFESIVQKNAGGYNLSVARKSLSPK